MGTEEIQFYFIDNEYYFRDPNRMMEEHGDLEKFAFFSKAVLSSSSGYQIQTGYYTLS